MYQDPQSTEVTPTPNLCWLCGLSIASTATRDSSETCEAFEAKQSGLSFEGFPSSEENCFEGYVKVTSGVFGGLLAVISEGSLTVCALVFRLLSVHWASQEDLLFSKLFLTAISKRSPMLCLGDWEWSFQMACQFVDEMVW